MDWLIAALSWIAGVLFSLAVWVGGALFWFIVWLVLPLALAAFIGVRVAEKVLGPEVVRAWVKRHALRYGAGAWHRARRLLFAVSAVPFRVLFYFAAFAVWHSVVSLFWRPKWSPWARAWQKRWRDPARLKKTAAKAASPASSRR